ncbi:MAG TPA: hypothetical protein VH743_05755 [Beijerinckiaceae bacterium]|jgi:hypothetical protein
MHSFLSVSAWRIAASTMSAYGLLAANEFVWPLTAEILLLGSPRHAGFLLVYVP